MSQPRVFVSRMMHPDAIALIGEATDMEVWPDDPPPTAEQLRAKLANAEGVLINIMDRVDAALLDAAPKLRVVSQLAAGLDNVDIPECTRRGILLGSTPGILSKAVADHAFALLLSAARRVVESDKWVRGNNWELAFHPNYWLGTEVQGSTLGIVGLGQIGLEVARRAQGLRYARPVPLAQPPPRRRGTIRADLRYDGRPVGRVGLRFAPRSADPRNAASHKRRCTAADEVHGHPDQHLARAGGGH